MAWPSLSCLTFPLPLLHVIYGITTLPNSILSTLTIKCIFPGIPHLCTYLMGNSLHIGLTKIPTSECRTHELTNLFPSFQHLRCIKLPSHLLWLTIPLAKDSLLLGSDTRTWYASLMPITVIYMIRFWVKKMQTWHLHKMEQHWHTILTTLVWEHRK